MERMPPSSFDAPPRLSTRFLARPKPRDIPVEEPTRYEFAINWQAAKRLGLVVPYSMQLLADKVIE